MRGKRLCRLHGGKSTGGKTNAGIQRIRATHWKNGSRSARLQAEFRTWCRKQEAKTVAILMDARKDVPLGFYALMGVSPIPKFRVRGIGTWPTPPKEWEEDNASPVPWQADWL
jgi:hypothetical protein